MCTFYTIIGLPISYFGIKGYESNHLQAINRAIETITFSELWCYNTCKTLE